MIELVYFYCFSLFRITATIFNCLHMLYNGWIIINNCFTSAWIEENNIKNYLEYKDQLIKSSKTAAFKEAVQKIEEYISDPVVSNKSIVQAFRWLEKIIPNCFSRNIVVMQNLQAHMRSRTTTHPKVFSISCWREKPIMKKMIEAMLLPPQLRQLSHSHHPNHKRKK